MNWPASKVTVVTDRFDRALLYASHVHGGQVRKGTTTPYLAHLLAVAATVLEYGGDEDLAIAALLHDSVEDQGGKARLEDVHNRFGERVARVVQACSDSLTDTAKGIRERAYEIWIASGYRDGMAEQHWLAAEQEILSGPRSAAVAKAPAKRIRGRATVKRSEGRPD